MSKEKMNSRISKTDRKNRIKHRRKTKQNINKLFNHLRETSQNASQNSSQSNLDYSIIDLDETENTVTSVNDQLCIGVTLNNLRTSNIPQESLIVIPDDDQTNACLTPRFNLDHSNIDLDETENTSVNEQRCIGITLNNLRTSNIPQESLIVIPDDDQTNACLTPRFNLDHSNIDLDETENTITSVNDQRCIGITLNNLKTSNILQESLIVIPDDDQTNACLTPRFNLDHSNIDLDETENTVTSVNDQRCIGISLNDLRTSNIAQESLIVIPDDDQTNACLTPRRHFSLHHSTPKIKQSLDNLILLQSNNNINLQNLNGDANSTREINRDSYLTIDLTTDTGFNKSEPTVINLANTTDQDPDVTLVSASNISNVSSMSGDSDVTALQQPMSRKLKKFTKGIANLNASEKGKLLEHITKTIFNGCALPTQVQNSLTNLPKSLPRAPESADDTYIKEMILGGKASRASVCSTGSNVHRPRRRRARSTGPRMVVIDGSNVAMEHGLGKQFSVRGLQICIDYFLRRGHVVKAFVPRFRCKRGMSSDGRLLDYLERRGLVVYTPSREVKGRTITPYDDRYIIQCAAEFEGVIVSGDNYRDLINENERWRFVIENRLLPFTWVDDMIMFPKDPYGRGGPSLEQLLRHDAPPPPTNQMFANNR